MYLDSHGNVALQNTNGSAFDRWLHMIKVPRGFGCRTHMSRTQHANMKYRQRADSLDTPERVEASNDPGGLAEDVAKELLAIEAFDAEIRGNQNEHLQPHLLNNTAEICDTCTVNAKNHDASIKNAVYIVMNQRTGFELIAILRTKHKCKIQ